MHLSDDRQAGVPYGALRASVPVLWEVNVPLLSLSSILQLSCGQKTFLDTSNSAHSALKWTQRSERSRRPGRALIAAPRPPKAKRPPEDSFSGEFRMLSFQTALPPSRDHSNRYFLNTHNTYTPSYTCRCVSFLYSKQMGTYMNYVKTWHGPEEVFLQLFWI